MAPAASPQAPSRGAGIAAALRRGSWWAVVPAAAFPILFLHIRYQPKVDIGVGSTTVGVALSDVTVLAVVLAAALAGRREGWQPLRAGRSVWLLSALFLGLVVVATFHPLLWQEDYRFLTHLVTAAKFCEYALLAPALPLLVRRRVDSLPLLWSAAAWSAAASVWGVLQFAGLVSELEGRRPLRREPSFVGIHDFAALSGAAFALGLALLALGRRNRAERIFAAVTGIAGGIGLVLAGAFAGVIAVGLAAVAVLAISRARQLLTRARALAVVGCTVVVAGGVLLMRAGEIPEFLRDLGIGSRSAGPGIESYAHRSLLAYIGVRIFIDHPVVGVGWQGSGELENYGPYLEDARRRFPRAPAVAFPSPDHPWGVQSAYLQTLTDLGVIGLVALIALIVTGVALGVRAALRAPPDDLSASTAGVLWLLVAAGVWSAMGLVAGIPLDALLWLAFGLAAAAAAWSDDARAG